MKENYKWLLVIFTVDSLWEYYLPMSDVIGGRGKSGNTKMATTVKWYVGEDGCLSVGEAATGVTYHPTLNTIIVATNAHTLKVYDVTSGCLLKESNLSGKQNVLIFDDNSFLDVNFGYKLGV